MVEESLAKVEKKASNFFKNTNLKRTKNTGNHCDLINNQQKFLIFIRFIKRIAINKEPSRDVSKKSSRINT